MRITPQPVDEGFARMLRDGTLVFHTCRKATAKYDSAEQESCPESKTEVTTLL